MLGEALQGAEDGGASHAGCRQRQWPTRDLEADPLERSMSEEQSLDHVGEQLGPPAPGQWVRMSYSPTLTGFLLISCFFFFFFVPLGTSWEDPKVRVRSAAGTPREERLGDFAGSWARAQRGGGRQGQPKCPQAETATGWSQWQPSWQREQGKSSAEDRPHQH